MMKRSAFAAAVGGALLMGLVVGAGASAAFDFSGCSVPAFNYLFNGQPQAPQASDIVAGDPNVIVCNGTSYVPIRYVARALGATVSWDQSTLTASITTGGSSGGNSSSQAPAPAANPAPASPTAGPWTSQGITYSNAQVTLDSMDNSPIVAFQARNTTSGGLGVSFTVSFFDGNGKLLGTADGADMNLPAGQTKTEQAAGLTAVAGWSSMTIQTSEEIPASQ